MKYNIAMVSDFFLPNLGGIEVHILNLSLNLIKRGHKVIVVTHHQYGEPKIKFIKSLKVYYLPISVMYNNCTWPLFFGNFFLLKDIFQNEQIEIIHGHQSMSPLAYEAILIGQIYNLKTVFTDHSLFASSNLENIIVNRFSEFVFINANKVICVSYALKENFLERVKMNHKKIFVIPNGVSNQFSYLKKKKCNRINIIVCCRFVYRKGVDLLLKTLPKICQINSKINIYLIGDGPKRDEIEQMIDDTNAKITLIGTLSQKKLNLMLNKCHIFLNTSLTESFCIANLEAACCGLKVVSTDVGGVREVLPNNMIKLVKPSEKGIIEGINDVLKEKRVRKNSAIRIKKVYSWKKVSEETEFVYDTIKESKNNFSKLFYNTGEGEKWLFRMILLILLFFKLISPNKKAFIKN